MATITIPHPPPPPEQDSENLRKAFVGLGTDEKAVIDILCHRSANQRKQISEVYQQLYNQTLIHSLKSELSGDFLKAVILWVTDPAQRDASLAYDALRKKGLKYLSIIVEIACASSPHQLIAIRQAYCSLYNCSLEEDISLYVAQPLRKLLVSVVSSYRYDEEEVDESIAKSESSMLFEAIKKKDLDDDQVIRILSTRNKFQLKATFNCYKQDYGKPIEKDIKHRSSGDFAMLLRTIVWCIDCPERHFAEVVQKAIKGLGTDEDSLTRAIVTRAEIDLARVKEVYKKEYQNSLVRDVKGDTSGWYKEFLVTLIGDDIKDDKIKKSGWSFSFRG